MDWMKNLPKHQRKKRLAQIALPGSHDSGAYYLNKQGPLSSNQFFLYNFGKDFVYNWGKTQDLDFRQQLEIGVRYFDLRVEANPNDNNIHFVHGLFAKPVEEELKVINEFLSSHPSEVVILDFNHFVGVFEPQQHDAIGKMIKSCFTTKLRKKPSNPLDVTLQEMQDKKQQVVVIYHEASQKDFLWNGMSSITSNWPNAQNKKNLIKFLNDDISKRPPSKLYVAQGILTPAVTDNTLAHVSSLKSWSGSTQKTVLSWVVDNAPQLNIVMVDFVDKNFVKAIISCNGGSTQGRK